MPLAQRLGQGARLTGGFGAILSRAPAGYAAGFRYDSLVYEPGYRRCPANEFAPGQVFCGTDCPHAIMETGPCGFIRSSPLDEIDAVGAHAACRCPGFEQS